MSADPLQLERHTAFAARLARGLVVDENLAEDLVQDTWLAVLQRPPRDRSALRSYVATTLRRFAGRTRRGTARRSEREREAARPESLPSSAELVSAMEQHQRVVEALLQLNDATRSAILLRYLEGLAPRDIAARSSEPVETIRTRIKRGMAELRERLDAREGGRGAWATALLPLARVGDLVAPLPAPASPGLETITATQATSILVMTTQAKLAVGATLALTAGLVWYGFDEPTTATPARTPDVRAALSTPTSTPEPEPIDEPSVERAAVVVPDATPAPPDEVAPLAITGTIRVLDHERVAHEAEDGAFTIALRDGELEVEVRAGRFAFERPARDDVRGDLRIGSIDLGGRPAFLDANRVALPADGEELELVVSWAPPSILRVVDARTQLDLKDVTLVRGALRTRGAVHPGRIDPNATLFARGVDSPVELRAFDATESWWVHAPGHQWGWARIDHRAGGERLVALEPGGADLTVVLEGFDPGLNLWLHLFPAGWDRSIQSLAAVRHPDAGTVTFEGLPPGPIQVRAELGIWHDGPRELAREELELAAGAKHEVVLALDANGGLPRAVPLAGRIVLPAGHPDVAFDFELRPVEGAALRKADHFYGSGDRLERVPGQPRVRRFDAGDVTPGSYLFVSTSLQWWEPFEVGPGGAPDVEIALPELGEVRVRVVDDATSEPLDTGRIDWSAIGRPSELSSWTLARVDASAEGEYTFVAPTRRILISTRSDEYGEASCSLEVAPGTQERELRLRRLAGTWLRLVDGDATVPIEWSWNLAVKHTDAAPRAKARITRIENGRAWIAASEPGTYVVEFGEVAGLDGFEPIAPRTLDLALDAADEVVVELVRR